MLIEDAKFIAQVVEDYTYLEVKVIPEYSGKGMFGATTAGLAIKGNIRSVLMPLAYMALEAQPDSPEAEKIEDVLYALNNIKEDSLGLKTIYY